MDYSHDAVALREHSLIPVEVSGNAVLDLGTCSALTLNLSPSFPIFITHADNLKSRVSLSLPAIKQVQYSMSPRRQYNDSALVMGMTRHVCNAREDPASPGPETRFKDMPPRFVSY